MNRIAAFLGAYAAASYVADVIVRPDSVARQAIAYARARNKPVINVGAGTRSSSLRAALLGPTLWGDVNIDIAADPAVPPGPHRVSFGDAHRLPYPNKHFGALVASHVLEHMDNPVSAMREFDRVADKVFIITPRWWAPHTWLHPGHQWVIDDRVGLSTMRPLHRHEQNRATLERKRTVAGLPPNSAPAIHRRQRRA